MDFNDIVNFGSDVSDRANVQIKELDDLKVRLKSLVDLVYVELETGSSLDSSRIKDLNSLIDRILKIVELVGKYTGDLRNRNENININLDATKSLLLYHKIASGLMSEKQRKEFLTIYEQETGNSIRVRKL